MVARTIKSALAETGYGEYIYYTLHTLQLTAVYDKGDGLALSFYFTSAEIDRLLDMLRRRQHICYAD
jgi:hypothetical protein